MAASWQVPCWKFEKLQIMLLEFEYLGSSEKSEKIHKYYTYRAIITKIYKAQWQVLTEIQAIQISNWGLISRQETSLTSGRHDCDAHNDGGHLTLGASDMGGISLLPNLQLIK